MQVCALTKVQPSSHVYSFGNYYHTTTFCSSLVYESLNLGGVYASVGKDAVVGKDIQFSKFRNINVRSVLEPSLNLSAVRP